MEKLQKFKMGQIVSAQWILAFALISAVFMLLIVGILAGKYRRELEEARSSRSTADLVAQLENARKGKETLEADLQTAREKEKALQAQVLAAGKGNENLQAQLQEARKGEEESRKRVLAAEKSMKDRDTELQGSKKREEDLQARLLTAQKAQEEAAKRLAQENQKKLDELAKKSAAEAGALKKERDDLAASKGKIQQELDAVVKDRNFLKGEMEAFRGEIEKMRAESAKSKAASDAALKASSEATMAAVTEIKGKIEATGTNLEGGTAKLDEALKRSDALAAEVANLTKKLEETGRLLADLQAGQKSAEKRASDLDQRIVAALSRLASQDPAAPGVARTSGTPEESGTGEKKAATPGKLPAKGGSGTVEGSVVDAQEGYLVIDKGENDGVGNGWEFEIRRNGSVIARAEVKRIKAEFTGAQIISTEQGEEVRKGDVAVGKPK